MSGWQTEAACRDTDPELFFPPSDDWTSAANARALIEAGRVCAGCPVRRECLTWALESGVTHGIWAGLSPVELAAIRRARHQGVSDPEVNRDPMCPGCSLLFPVPAVDGTPCWLCQERSAA